jgi:hypothetical protein
MMLDKLEEMSVLPTMEKISKLDFKNMDYLELKN